MIIVDTHEPKIFISKIEELGVPVQQEHLEVGDYIIGDIIVERKDIRDFINSLRSGRIFQQLYNMKNTGMKGYLVLIGDIPKYDWSKSAKIDKKKYQYFLRSIRSIQLYSYLSYNIGFIHLQNNKEFIEFIKMLWNYSGKKPSSPVVVKKERDPIKIKLDILTRIPGIGYSIAEELHKQGLTIKNLASMSIEELSNITVQNKRLGEIRSKRINEVLNT